eukprot:2273902-Prymnesium_polylepis.1
MQEPAVFFAHLQVRVTARSSGASPARTGGGGHADAQRTPPPAVARRAGLADRGRNAVEPGSCPGSDFF